MIETTAKNGQGKAPSPVSAGSVTTSAHTAMKITE